MLVVFFSRLRELRAESLFRVQTNFVFLSNSTTLVFQFSNDLKRGGSSMIQNVQQLVKVAGLQLTPFFKGCIVYFVIGSFEFWNSNVLSTILKCLPIVCLIAFVLFMGFRLTKDYKYQQLILLGLIFSCAGDALLDYQSGELFQYGMMAFAVAQIFYISAFGWRPFKLLIGVIFYVLGAFSVSLMFKNFEGILVFGVPIYCLLLLTMGWRSNARIQNMKNLPKIFCGIGGILFVISDSLIAFDKFYAPIKYSGILIMVTYYIAQLGITLSILDHEMRPAKIEKSN